jgi:hypothetical protein
MKFSDLPLNPTPRALRQFTAAWFILFLTMALRQALAHGNKTAGWMLAAIAFIGLFDLLKPFVMRWLFIGATVAAFPAGWLVTQLMLAIMFYLVLTPVALVFRWRGRDELQLKRKTEQPGFWISRGEPPKAEQYLKQF